MRPWHQEDVVLFLSKDGDCEPIYLWREPKVRPTPLVPSAVANGTLLGGAEEPVDAGLKAFFEERGLSALCYDVCRALKEMGVEHVDDLTFLTPQDLDDELPKYLKIELKTIQKRKLSAIIGLQPTTAGGQHIQGAQAGPSGAKPPTEGATRVLGSASTHAVASGTSS